MPRNVCPADRIKLEETLLGRWKAREVNRLLYRLEQWAGWSWATEQAIRKAVPYCSQPIRARRVREARAQLPAMLRLPPLTPPEDVTGLRQRIAFDVVLAGALVLPEHRVLGGLVEVHSLSRTRYSPTRRSTQLPHAT